MTTGRILVVGAGTAGRSLAESITSAGGQVVGYLDDVKTGPEILGTLADVNQVVAAHQVDVLHIAIPTVQAGRVREFLSTIDSPHLEIAIIPRTYDIISKEIVDINDLSDVDVLDLVGREPVKHDLLEAHRFIEGKRVLITGAAGSIGSRLASQIARLGAAQVICVDRWENGMFFLSQELAAHSNIEMCIADVTDSTKFGQLLDQYTPDAVFHAAAYKHVPLMQSNAVAAITNNIWGTLNVLQASAQRGIRNVVYVSTDKAVNPVNVMGATKRVGEMMMEALAEASPQTIFTAVRFGNVIESNGSVMQTFRKQITEGGPVTVTHSDVTRFFMTIDEASQLIIQSASLGQDREIFVLDMGEPVRILDLARGLVQATRPGVEIVITGLRPGEKLFEELSYEPDKVQRTSNDKIFVSRAEQEFNHADFMAEVTSLIEAAQSHALSNDDAVARLRSLGFAIQ
jgi:FlaA1/EpsC-like NDP-sugar epimerase